MLVIAGAIGHYLLALAGVFPSTADNSNTKTSYGSIAPGQIPADDAISAINPQSAGLVQ
jgi:hypothetical protein